MLTLYHGDSAVCAAKVRVTLAEKNIPWEGKLLDLGRGDQFDPEYIKLNANAVVPTLLHDGNVLTESTVINEYLDEAFPDRPLRPSDAVGRAKVRLWTKREDSIHDVINTMTTAILFRAELMKKTPEERAKRYEAIPDPARREKWRELLDKGLESNVVRDGLARFAKLLRDMEKALAHGPWLTGDGFTLADVGLISFFYRMELLEADVWRDHFPRVTDWFARCKARPSFEKAIGALIPTPRRDHYRNIATPTRPAVVTAFERTLAHAS